MSPNHRIAIMPNCPSYKITVSPGTHLYRSCSASIPEPAVPTADLEQEVRSPLDQWKKIEAVRIYKEHTGSGLKAPLIVESPRDATILSRL